MLASHGPRQSQARRRNSGLFTGSVQDVMQRASPVSRVRGSRGSVCAPRLEFERVAGDHVPLGVRTQGRDLRRELAGAERVVGVEVLHELAPRAREPAIAGGRRAGIALAHVVKPPVGASVGAGPAGHGVLGGVGRAVIDHDEFDRPVRLGEHRLQRFQQQRRTVVRRHDHADPAGFVEGAHARSRRIQRQAIEGSSTPAVARAPFAVASDCGSTRTDVRNRRRRRRECRDFW